jgi:hypothetical protein
LFATVSSRRACGELPISRSDAVGNSQHRSSSAPRGDAGVNAKHAPVAAAHGSGESGQLKRVESFAQSRTPFVDRSTARTDATSAGQVSAICWSGRFTGVERSVIADWVVGWMRGSVAADRETSTPEAERA